MNPMGDGVIATTQVRPKESVSAPRSSRIGPSDDDEFLPVEALGLHNLVVAREVRGP